MVIIHLPQKVQQIANSAQIWLPPDINPQSVSVSCRTWKQFSAHPMTISQTNEQTQITHLLISN